MKRYGITKMILVLGSMTGWSMASADTLGFKEALNLAEQQSPSLAANTARINAAQSTAVAAGALPDPKLVTGLDNYPVTGSERGQLYADFMTMQRVGLMQDVPNAIKRQARKEVAQADILLAQAERKIIRLKVRQETALAWLNVYYLERKTSLFDQLDQENHLLDLAVRAQVASGHGTPADLVLPRMEAAAQADRRDDLARDIRKARSNLTREVGPLGEATLTGTPPPMSVDATHLRTHVHHHPDLMIFDDQTRKAESEVHEARAEKHSDWGVEMDYEHRAPQFGDMVSVQFTFSLPISPHARQDPIIAAKTREINRITEEREAMLRDHINEVDNLLADYDALTHQWQRNQETTLPLSQTKVNLLTAEYRSGQADLASLVAARRDLLDQKIKRIDLENARMNAAIELNFATGEDQP